MMREIAFNLLVMFNSFSMPLFENSITISFKLYSLCMHVKLHAGKCQAVIRTALAIF